MRDRKLVRILSRMEPDERKEFAEFLRSPLHSHRPKLGEMVDLMETMLFDESEAAVSSEEYHEAVYPGKDYDANNLNRLISLIFKELKEYLAFVQYRKDRAARHVYTVREYADRKWADMTFAGMKEARRRLDSEIPEGEDYYYRHYQIGKIEGEYWVENMPKKPGLIYQPALDRLDEFYLLGKAKYMVLAINHDRHHDMEHKPSFSEIIELASKNDQVESLLIRLFIQIYQCRLNPESKDLLDNYLTTLKEEIPFYDTSENQISEGPLIFKYDAELLYGMAFNLCSDLRHKHGNAWVPVLHTIMEEAIRKGVFLNKGKLYDKLFSTQIKMLCVTGFVNLAMEFYDNFNAILSYNQDNSVSDYSKALILYFQKQFVESNRMLLALKMHINTLTDYILANDCRLLLCLCWYRINEFESMVHEVNAFRTHLNREVFLTADSKNSYKRFCRAILSFERILGGKPSLVKEGLTKLKSEISPSRINGKSLIVEMIDEKLS